MAQANFFESFSEAFVGGDIDFESLYVYLSNTTPSASDDLVKSDLAEISTGNGYAGPIDIEAGVSRSGATTTITAVNKTVTATGNVASFRYVVLAGGTGSSAPLLLWWDYGSEVSLENEDEFIMDFDGSVLSIGPSA